MNPHDRETRAKHERIWRQFIERPEIRTRAERAIRIPGVVALFGFTAPIDPPAIAQRLETITADLSSLPCIKPFTPAYWHMTIVPGALLTSERPDPPSLLPASFPERAFELASKAVSGYGVFAVEIKGLNLFRDVVVAVPYDGGHLAELRRRIRSSMPELPERYLEGYEPLPHISLASYKSREGISQLIQRVKELREMEIGSLEVRRIEMVRVPLEEGELGVPERVSIPID